MEEAGFDKQNSKKVNNMNCKIPKYVSLFTRMDISQCGGVWLLLTRTSKSLRKSYFFKSFVCFVYFFWDNNLNENLSLFFCFFSSLLLFCICVYNVSQYKCHCDSE